MHQFSYPTTYNLYFYGMTECSFSMLIVIKDVLIQYKNQQMFGYVQIVFNDKTTQSM